MKSALYLIAIISFIMFILCSIELATAANKGEPVQTLIGLLIGTIVFCSIFIIISKK